jgi:hypothetical protein
MSQVNLWAMFGGMGVSFAALSLVRIRFDGARATFLGVPGEENKPTEKPTLRSMLINALISFPALMLLFIGPWYGAVAAAVLAIALYHIELGKLAKKKGWLSTSPEATRFVIAMTCLSIVGWAIVFAAFLQARFT